MKAIIFALMITVLAVFPAYGKKSISKFERQWTTDLLEGKKASLFNRLAIDIKITHNFKGQPARTTFNKLMAKHKGCKLSENPRSDISLLYKTGIFFDCGNGYPDVVEYEVKGGKISALHFYAFAPCPTSDCK